MPSACREQGKRKKENQRRHIFMLVRHAVPHDEANTNDARDKRQKCENRIPMVLA
jgi:hypothetical protein